MCHFNFKKIVFLLGFSASTLINPSFAITEKEVNHYLYNKIFFMPHSSCVENPSTDPDCIIPSENEIKKFREYTSALKSFLNNHLEEIINKQLVFSKKFEKIIADLNDRYGDNNKLSIFYEDLLIEQKKKDFTLVNDAIYVRNKMSTVENFLDKIVVVFKISDNHERFMAYDQLYKNQYLSFDAFGLDTLDEYSNVMDDFNSFRYQPKGGEVLIGENGEGLSLALNIVNCDFEKIDQRGIFSKRLHTTGSKFPFIGMSLNGETADSELDIFRDSKLYENLFLDSSSEKIPLTISCKEINEDQKKLPSFDSGNRTLTVYYSVHKFLERRNSDSPLHDYFGIDTHGIAPIKVIRYESKTSLDDILKAMGLKKGI